MPILLEPVNQNNNPFIEWEKATSSEAEEKFLLYDLQRSINYGSFHTIFQTDNYNTTSYLDQATYWDPNQSSTSVRYRVGAFYVDLGQFIEVSNYQEINTSDIWIHWKITSNYKKTEYNLSNNYPNPFNPSTQISFRIPEPGFVSLTIYDPLGREIKQLVNEFKDAGSYTNDFDAYELSSGTYFYTLRVNNYLQTKQMLLLK